MKRTGRSQALTTPNSRTRRERVPATTARGSVEGLPVELTSFVGRRREMTELQRMLSASRLVTLTGPGGVGKTRLAMKMAADRGRAFSDGVFLVELDQLRDPALLVHAVADALGLPEMPPCLPRSVLAEYLAQKQVLLILDNCEHLVEAVAALADEILRRCPQLRIMATSRERLGAPAEATLVVPSLSIPDPRRPCSLQELFRFEAVMLFVDRAAARRPEFRLTESNQRAVVEICRRLDGLPLAIELAAVWLNALPPREIADRLEDRFRLLSAGMRCAPTRQQTLRSCIQWSYDLCSPREQLLWARLAVFNGGFRLDAAEGVCAGEDLAVRDVSDVVASLIDKSILVPENHGTVMRYRLLDSIREYGREKLSAAEFAALRRRQRGWYADLVARVNAALGIGVAAWRQGDPQGATELLKQSLRLKQEMDDFLGTGWCLEALAWIAAGEHDHRRAATLLGAAEALAQATGTSLAALPDLLVAHEQCERETRRRLGEQAFQAAFGCGMELGVDEAVGYALREKPQAKPSLADVREAPVRLTRREHQVAELIAQGMSNKDIASRLVISQRTAEGHVERILVKFGFVSRTQIAVWAARQTGDKRDT